MTQEVFMVDAKDYGKLEKLLSSDPYSDCSFTKAGYVLKESKALGQPAGFYIVFFESLDGRLIKALAEKLLEAIPLARRPEQAARDLVVSRIREEQDSAASGFGSIFGQ
jgi:hypothetical protein